MILGHQKQWQFLKKAAQLNRLSHAYLFTGQDKLGKKKIALEWVSFLFSSTACQDFNKKQEPDLLLVEPETNDYNSDVSSDSQVTSTRASIQISQIRELIRKLSLKPFSAPFKVAVIDRAHLMNQEAQSALLKTLEEPRGKTILILITEFPEALFSTILSRTQIVKFYPVKKQEIKNYIKKQGISEEKAEEISKVSFGKPGIAIDFISNPERLENFNQKLREIDKILNSPLAFRFQYAKKLSQDREDLKETLEIWLTYFRNNLLDSISNQQLTNNNKQKFSSHKLKKALELIQATIFLTSTTNVNTKLALENLMLEF